MKRKSIIWGIVTLLVLWFVLFPSFYVETEIYKKWIAPGIFCISGTITLFIWAKNEIINQLKQK